MRQLLEIWVAISGYEGLYEVSNFGRIRRIHRLNKVDKEAGGKILTPRTHANGYKAVILYKNKGRVKEYYVHRIVGEHFIEKPNPKFEINHIDENKANNHIDNLVWVSHGDNIRWSTKSAREERARRANEQLYSLQTHFA